jgi:hypothetical protein
MIGNKPWGDPNTGYKQEFVHVPYVVGENTVLAHLNTSYYHVHGKPFVYPNLADEIQLTSGSGVWSTTGAITEVIPADTLTTAAFDIHWINISSISANSTIQIDVFSGDVGSEVLISSVRATRTIFTSQNGAHRIQIPQQIEGTRISARLSDSNSSTVNCLISFEGHFYAS